MTQLPNDVALRIVRWCWPERVWVRDPDGIDPDLAYSDGPPFSIYRDFTERDDVAHAERVVIERGLAEDYGCALVDELGFGGPPGPDGPSLYEVWGKIATAPIEARVRALLAVIEQEKKNQ